jgi:tetratricopeptide (TPR) repeat protein
LHKILRSDPQRYLRIVNEWIRDSPANADAYFSRHFAWMKIGDPQRALDDLNQVEKLHAEPEPLLLMSRGEVYRHIGEYEKALKDLNRAEVIDPRGWQDDIVFGLLYQADSHARLGNEAAALHCCSRLPDNFWTPGINGAPSGNKAEVTENCAALPRLPAESGADRANALFAFVVPKPAGTVALILPATGHPVALARWGPLAGREKSTRREKLDRSSLRGASATKQSRVGCYPPWIASP